MFAVKQRQQQTFSFHVLILRVCLQQQFNGNFNPRNSLISLKEFDSRIAEEFEKCREKKERDGGLICINTTGSLTDIAAATAENPLLNRLSSPEPVEPPATSPKVRSPKKSPKPDTGSKATKKKRNSSGSSGDGEIRLTLSPENLPRPSLMTRNQLLNPFDSDDETDSVKKSRTEERQSRSAAVKTSESSDVTKTKDKTDRIPRYRSRSRDAKNPLETVAVPYPENTTDMDKSEEIANIADDIAQSFQTHKANGEHSRETSSSKEPTPLSDSDFTSDSSTISREENLRRRARELLGQFQKEVTEGGRKLDAEVISIVVAVVLTLHLLKFRCF